MRGAALRPDDIRANFALLRELGANMTRSHYPMHPLALELADRYGIVVWSEVPVYQMRDQLFRSAAVRRRARAAGARHGEPRPQPPVGDRVEPRQREHLEAGPRLHALRDAMRRGSRGGSTRRGSWASPSPAIRRSASRTLYTKLDALGVNDYFGWYAGPLGSITDRAGLAPYLQRLHDDYPEAGAVRDRVRRRGQPLRACRPRRARSNSSAISWISI